MKVLRIKPMCRPEVIEIDGSLESLQKEVGGMIQATYPWDDKVALICNDEDIIKDAVDKAVVNRTDYAIQRATSAAITDIHAETARQVKSAINKEYVTLQGSVKKEIKDQLGRIDISDLREEVKDEAKNQLAESMEDILDNFNDNLKNVKKIYGSISDAITGNQGGKETVVKIS